MDWYLIEARSIWWLSWSPVFVNLWLHRYIEWTIKQSNWGPVFFLLGMIYGHFDTDTTNIDNIDTITEEDISKKPDRINVWIAIVTPINKVIELLDQIEAARKV